MGEHVARSADTGDGFFTCLVGPNTISRRSKVAEAEVNIYNYLQPVGNVVVCKAAGLGVFHAAHVAAKVLVFGGVWLVNKSKSCADRERNELSLFTTLLFQKASKQGMPLTVVTN